MNKVSKFLGRPSPGWKRQQKLLRALKRVADKPLNGEIFISGEPGAFVTTGWIGVKVENLNSSANVVR